jgi:thiol-disulfide isomerase/thioredoxin
MSNVCSHRAWRRAAAFVAACAIAATAVRASPSSVERFDVAAWEHLQQELPRPSAVVFTATYCVSCPAVLEKVSLTLKQKRIRSDLVAVVIDEASSQELLSSGHYDHASRLFLFEGNEAALRYQVDRRWRGVTPYTVLLSANGKAVFVAGIPSDAQLASWLGSSVPATDRD